VAYFLDHPVDSDTINNIVCNNMIEQL